MKPKSNRSATKRLFLTGVALVWLAACDLPDPPAPTSPRPTSLLLLAITMAPTRDTNATATTLARPVTLTPEPVATAFVPTRAPADAAPTPERYTVQPGDTLTTLATRFDTTVDELVAINELTDPNAIEDGQELLIPPAGAP